MTHIQPDLEDFIEIQIKAGFDDRETIIEEACELFAHETQRGITRTHIARRVDDYLEAHFAEQKLWTYTTDCDRLDEAFAMLDRNGIVARHHFTCCQTCGHNEIGAEIDDALEHREVRGYVFYHRQDTRRAIETDILYLAYGAIDGKEDASLAVGHEIVAALEQAGLMVTWDGSIMKRIGILDLVWQRRRLPEALLTI